MGMVGLRLLGVCGSQCLVIHQAKEMLLHRNKLSNMLG
jgi:hypothetical protein